MNETNKLSIGQRLMSDTPDFFKKLDIFGYLIILIAAVLLKFSIPLNVVIPVFCVGSTMSIISKFAVKDVGNLADGLNAVNVLTTITSLVTTVNDLKDTFKNPVIPDLNTATQNVIQAIQDQNVVPLQTPAAPVQNSPVVSQVSQSPVATDPVPETPKPQYYQPV